MEAALAILTLVVVVAFAAGGIAAVGAQVRCVDAAREAARLAARGDDASALAAARSVAPGGAHVEVRRDGGFARAIVTVRSLLPGIGLGAEAVAALEPTG